MKTKNNTIPGRPRRIAKTLTIRQDLIEKINQVKGDLSFSEAVEYALISAFLPGQPRITFKD